MATSIITQSTRLDLRYCAENKPPDTDFAIPGLVVGTVGVIVAAGSTGKSYWLTEAAAGVCSKGADKALLNLGIQNHGRALILNAEDPQPILWERWHAICSHLSQEAREEVYEKLTIESLMGVMPRTDVMNDDWLASVIDAAQGCRLVVIDTLIRWHSAEENDNGAMSAVLSRFEAVCRATGAAVLLAHHVGKSMSRDGRQSDQTATRGAAAITDNSRWQGWMQSMGAQDAEKYGICEDERWRYVQTGSSKNNYTQGGGDCWLERKEGGVLIPANLKESSLKEHGQVGKKRGFKHD